MKLFKNKNLIFLLLQNMMQHLLQQYRLMQQHQQQLRLQQQQRNQQPTSRPAVPAQPVSIYILFSTFY